MNSLFKTPILPFVLACVLAIAASAFALRFMAHKGKSSTSQTLGEQSSKREILKEPGPDQPDGAARFRRLQLQDENGFIPPDGWEKARQHVARMKLARQEQVKARRQSSPQVPSAIDEAGIKPDSWTWLGPGNVGGRIRAFVIDPANANNMWVGSVGGGLWRSTNAGVSWFPVNDILPNLAITTLVINPANNNIMYAGTGEGFGNIDAIEGGGIYQSTDRGVTWNLLPLTNPADPAICAVRDSNCAWRFVNRLAISPNGNTLLAATNNGIFRSTNNGVSWAQHTTASAMDVDFLVNDSNRAIVGELGSARFTLDGGQNWTQATFTPAIANGGTPATNGRVELANALFTSLVYAAVNQNNGEVYRSNDGGQSYSRVNTGNNIFLGAGNQGWYDNIIWLNPQDPDTVVVGGINLWRGRYNGSTFNLPLTQISSAAQNSAHPDQHVIVAHPGFNNVTNRIVYFGNDGGLYRADDVSTVEQTVGWTNLNSSPGNAGLGITQFYGAAGNATSGVIIAGAQDNGTLRFSGNPQGWTSTNGADGGYCAADPTDANYFFGESQNLGIFRSSDGGQTSTYIVTGLSDQVCPPCRSNFIAPLLLDPNNSNTLLTGGWSLWRSTNAKAVTPTWAAIKAPNVGNWPISAIAVSPITSDLILVGHNDGSIFRTLNGASSSPSWTSFNSPVAGRMVTRLTVDTAHPTNWIYATFGGFNGDNVYRTIDNGVTWVDVTGSGATGLPNVPVFSLVVHPTNPNFVYLGTEVGVFTSEDAGATWFLPQDGPANVSVQELFWMGGDLVAVTHGRGLYRASGGLYVDCNYNGVQLGTFTQPYKSVAAALSASPTYRLIWLKPCNYNETYFLPNNGINNRVEIRSLGGTAAIGKP